MTPVWCTIGRDSTAVTRSNSPESVWTLVVSWMSECRISSCAILGWDLGLGQPGVERHPKPELVSLIKMNECRFRLRPGRCGSGPRGRSLDSDRSGRPMPGSVGIGQEVHGTVRYGWV